jgi:hypothetical protein
VLLLVVRRLEEQRGNLLKALLFRLGREIGILVPGLGLPGKRGHQIFLRLGTCIFGHSDDSPFSNSHPGPPARVFPVYQAHGLNTRIFWAAAEDHGYFPQKRAHFFWQFSKVVQSGKILLAKCPKCGYDDSTGAGNVSGNASGNVSSPRITTNLGGNEK